MTSSRQRVERWLRRETGWPPAVVPQVYGLAAVLSGESLQAYCTDGAVLARCQRQMAGEYGYDGVFGGLDMCVEAEALGAGLAYPRAAYPYVRQPCLDGSRDVDRLRVPDPARDGRMPEAIRACGLLRSTLDAELAVVGNATGPVTIAGQVMGLERLLFLIADDPEGFGAVLTFMSEVTLAYAAALARAGADVVCVSEPSASPAVIPPSVFQRWVAPVLRDLVLRLRQAGVPRLWLHIAGPTTGILPFYADMNPDLATIDWEVPIAAARRSLPNTCLIGNIKPFLFVTGGPDDVAAAVTDLLADGGGSGQLVISSGCELPLESRAENLRALVEAVRRAPPTVPVDGGSGGR